MLIATAVIYSRPWCECLIYFCLNSRDRSWMIRWFKWISLLFAPIPIQRPSFLKMLIGHTTLSLKRRAYLWWCWNDCPTPSGSHLLLKTMIPEKTTFISCRIKFCWLLPANYLHLNVHLIRWEFIQAKVQICSHQAVWNWLSLIKVILKIKI